MEKGKTQSLNTPYAELSKMSYLFLSLLVIAINNQLV